MAGAAWILWAVWIATGASALAGVILLYVGLLRDRARGRRRCPTCWYDLSGTPNSRTCSECGYEAASERALRRTRRRWGMALLGVMLIVASTLLVGYGRVDQQSIKPVWWLAYEMHSNGERGELARIELIDRGRDGRLSVAQQRRIADRVLALQADSDFQWHPPWRRGTQLDRDFGTLFEEAWERGSLTDEQIEQYARGAFADRISFAARGRIRAGERLRTLLTVETPRVGMRAHFRRSPSSRLALLGRVRSVDGAQPTSPEQLHNIRRIGHFNHPRTTSGPGLTFDTPGSHELTLTMDIAVVLESDIEHLWPSEFTDVLFDRALGRWEFTPSVTVEVVPPDAPSVTLVDDPALGERIREALTVEFGEYRMLRINRRPYSTRPGLVLVNSIPIDISFDVFVCAGDREEFIGSIRAYANRGYGQVADRLVHDPRELFPDHDVVDVIFRTGSAAAERTLNIDEVWDGEIVIESVPLHGEGLRH